MKNLVTGLVTLATAMTAITFGAATSSAATAPIADLAVYRLPAEPGLACRLGVTNNGPDIVQVQLLPLDLMAKGYRKNLGPVNPGQSVTVEFADCTRPSYSSNFFLYVQGSGLDGTASYDPNPLNNVFPLDN
ncbi:hypothetical protein ACQ7HM_09025 [Williamsia sp. MIQD14]|uniref:hypothetical protein n=1 Tax=Williamsia sp. MIQD14 TaxID=3425703 RepID=UPI003DA09505